MSVEAPPVAPHPSTGGYRLVPPAPLLRPFIETLWVHMVPGGVPDVRLLPDGRMNMVWSSQWGLWLAGPQSHWLNRPVNGPAVVVGARFRPGAAPALLRVPARELVDDRASLSAIDPGLTRRLERRLEGARFEAEALDAYNHELGRRLREPPELDPVVLEAVD